MIDDVSVWGVKVSWRTIKLYKKYCYSYHTLCSTAFNNFSKVDGNIYNSLSMCVWNLNLFHFIAHYFIEKNNWVFTRKKKLNKNDATICENMFFFLHLFIYLFLHEQMKRSYGIFIMNLTWYGSFMKFSNVKSMQDSKS